MLGKSGPVEIQASGTGLRFAVALGRRSRTLIAVALSQSDFDHGAIRAGVREAAVWWAKHPRVESVLSIDRFPPHAWFRRRQSWPLQHSRRKCRRAFEVEDRSEPPMIHSLLRLCLRRLTVYAKEAALLPTTSKCYNTIA